MKYAVFTVMTPEYSVEMLPKTLKAFGYDGVEWRVGEVKARPEVMPPRDRLYWDDNQATLDVNHIVQETLRAKKACDDAGIACYAFSSYLALGAFDKIEALMKAAASVDVKKIRLFPAAYDGSQNYKTLFDKERAELKTVVEMAKQYDVSVLLEQHMNTIIPSASAAYRMVEGYDPKYVGIVYDAGNMVHEGYEQYGIGIGLLGPYVHHVHIKDAVMTNGKAEWTPIGKGQVQFEVLLDALRKENYDGYFSFEDFSVMQSTEEKLKHNLQYIKGLWEGK